ncbi:uracil-DNA glycosylase [Nitrospirota bacterium]
MALGTEKADAAIRVLRFYEALGIDRVPLRIDDGSEALKAVRAGMGECTRCKLHRGRTNIVFGVGNPSARLMFIGEGPGKDEDAKGEPFVGEAGQLLDRLINRMGLSREEVYIANIVKCRPPGNRDPEDDEVESCTVFLRQQIEAIRPEVIMTLGRIAAHRLLETKVPITKLRGKFQRYGDIPVMPTFHPAYLLRNPKDKMLVWADAQEVLHKLGLEVK